MVNLILDSISITLYNQLGDKYTYYVEEVEQGLKKPCFSIQTLNPSVRSTGINSYRRTVPIVIHYFTDKSNTKDATKDNYAMAESLITALEYLPVTLKDSFLCRGESIEWEIVDGVLQFFITYAFITTKELEIYYMEEGTLNGVPM